MEKKITYQKMGKSCEDAFSLAIKYFGVVSVINDLGIVGKELGLLAHISVNGSRKGFYEKWGSSEMSVNNMVRRLRSKGVLVEGEDRVDPALLSGFENDVKLEINLKHET